MAWLAGFAGFAGFAGIILVFVSLPVRAAPREQIQQPKIVIPMHNFKADPKEFKDKVEARSDIKVVPLKIGEVYHLK